MRLLYCFLFLSYFSFGQQVQLKGKCVDKRELGVDFVQIKVYIKDSLLTSLYTDSSGVYVFNANLGDQLTLFLKHNFTLIV